MLLTAIGIENRPGRGSATTPAWKRAARRSSRPSARPRQPLTHRCGAAVCRPVWLPLLVGMQVTAGSPPGRTASGQSGRSRQLTCTCTQTALARSVSAQIAEGEALSGPGPTAPALAQASRAQVLPPIDQLRPQGACSPAMRRGPDRPALPAGNCCSRTPPAARDRVRDVFAAGLLAAPTPARLRACRRWPAIGAGSAADVPADVQLCRPCAEALARFCRPAAPTARSCCEYLRGDAAARLAALAAGSTCPGSSGGAARASWRA